MTREEKVMSPVSVLSERMHSVPGVPDREVEGIREAARAAAASAPPMSAKLKSDTAALFGLSLVEPVQRAA